MAISWEAHWSLVTWRGSWGQGGAGLGGSPSWEIEVRPQREGSVRPRIGVLVGSGWAEGATRLKLGGGSSWDSTVRGLHTPRVDSTGVGALFGQKGGDLDRIYALLRFTLSSEENFVIAEFGLLHKLNYWRQPNWIWFKVDFSIGKIGFRWILAPRVLQNFSYRRVWPPPQTQLLTATLIRFDSKWIFLLTKLDQGRFWH